MKDWQKKNSHRLNYQAPLPEVKNWDKNTETELIKNLITQESERTKKRRRKRINWGERAAEKEKKNSNISRTTVRDNGNA